MAFLPGRALLIILSGLEGIRYLYMPYNSIFFYSNDEDGFIKEVSFWLKNVRGFSLSTVRADSDWIKHVVRNNIKDTDDLTDFSRWKRAKIRRALRQIQEFEKYKLKKE